MLDLISTKNNTLIFCELTLNQSFKSRF